MKKTFTLIFLLSIFTYTTVFAQTFSVKGQVKSVSGTSIAKASVLLANTNYKALCDTAGNYQIDNITPGNYILRISTVGFKPTTKALEINGNLIVNTALEENIERLSDVNIVGK